MVRLGNFLFHYRNILFPLFYALLFLPSPLLFSNGLPMLIAGFIIGLSGQLTRMTTIGLVYIIRGGRDRRVYAEDLVTTGIFSHCRNPLYVGNILMITGLGLMSNSRIFIFLLIPLFLFFYQAIVRAEENFLDNKFGEPYREYMRKVNRWVPGLRGIGSTLRSMTFRWKRVWIKEYGTTLIWSTAALWLIGKYIQEQAGWVALGEKLPALLIAQLVLITLYLFVRYKKKTKQWKAD
ncbi:MAG: isoprenylcysteine carboxylmethyltransferase family protein [Bacteroidia bacterium]|nr:isoprenylcysteine carboxylmethyltransferase family protein [Bacteroidia bacterium]